MLFSSQLGMRHTAIHLLERRFRRPQPLETALPDEGVHRRWNSLARKLIDCGCRVVAFVRDVK
jgi:hypothetical protein